MEITELHAYKGNTWLLRMDGSEPPYFLHVSVVQKFHLQEGMRLPESAWEQVQTAELSRKAFQYACYLLDRRDYSYQEMYRKLEPKYPAAGTVYGTDGGAASGADLPEVRRLFRRPAGPPDGGAWQGGAGAAGIRFLRDQCCRGVVSGTGGRSR